MAYVVRKDKEQGLSLNLENMSKHWLLTELDNLNTRYMCYSYGLVVNSKYIMFKGMSSIPVASKYVNLKLICLVSEKIKWINNLSLLS